MKSARRRGALAITYHVTLTPRSAGGAAAAWQQETAQGTRVASQGCGTCCGAGRRGLGSVAGHRTGCTHRMHRCTRTAIQRRRFLMLTLSLRSKHTLQSPCSRRTRQACRTSTTRQSPLISFRVGAKSSTHAQGSTCGRDSESDHEFVRVLPAKDEGPAAGVDLRKGGSLRQARPHLCAAVVEIIQMKAGGYLDGVGRRGVVLADGDVEACGAARVALELCVIVGGACRGASAVSGSRARAACCLLAARRHAPRSAEPSQIYLRDRWERWSAPRW